MCATPHYTCNNHTKLALTSESSAGVATNQQDL